jgi:allophanate hydrolase subunit 1
MFDPRRDPPAYLVAGDVVRFRAIPATEWDAHDPIAADWG